MDFIHISTNWRFQASAVRVMYIIYTIIYNMYVGYRLTHQTIFFRRKSHPISLVAWWLITPLPPLHHVFFRPDKARFPLTLHTHTHTRTSAVASPFEWCIDMPPCPLPCERPLMENGLNSPILRRSILPHWSYYWEYIIIYIKSWLNGLETL